MVLRLAKQLIDNQIDDQLLQFQRFWGRESLKIWLEALCGNGLQQSWREIHNSSTSIISGHNSSTAPLRSPMKMSA